MDAGYTRMYVHVAIKGNDYSRHIDSGRAKRNTESFCMGCLGSIWLVCSPYIIPAENKCMRRKFWSARMSANINFALYIRTNEALFYTQIMYWSSSRSLWTPTWRKEPGTSVPILYRITLQNAPYGGYIPWPFTIEVAVLSKKLNHFGYSYSINCSR